MDLCLEMVLFRNKSLLCEGVKVTVNKERVKCSFGFVLTFARLLKCRDLGVTATNLPLKQMPVSSIARVGFL